MAMPTAQNGDEAAYAASAILDELIDLLVDKNLISHDDVKRILERATERLSNENSHAANRASNFLAATRNGQPSLD